MLLLDLICMFMGREPCVWRSGDDLEELVLSYCVGTRDQTQVIRFGSKRFQSLSRLKESQFFTLIISTKSYMTGDLTLEVMNWPLEFLTAWNSLTRSLYPLSKPSHFISLTAQWHTEYFLTIEWGSENVNDLGNTARNSSTFENLKA